MKQIIFYVGIFTLCFSCNSNDDSSNQDLVPPENNFYALTVGNSWSYKWYELDDRNDDPNLYTGITETLSIEDIEVRNNETYYKFKKVISGNPLNNSGIPTISNIGADGEYFELLRDSLGYLIDDSGFIKCVNNTTEEVLIYSEFDGLEIIYGQASEDYMNYSTEAGEFNCLEFTLSFSVYQGPTDHGISFYYFSDGIGLVSNIKRRFVNCDFCGFFEKRLDSYSVQ